MEVNSEIAFRAIRKNGVKILNDERIQTIRLIRSLDSEEAISPDMYEEMTDKTKNWSNTDSLEHLLKHLRTNVQADGQLFVSFVKVLNDCGYNDIAMALLETYNFLIKEEKSNVFLELSEKGEVLCRKDETSTTSPTTSECDLQNIEVLPLRPVFKSKGYEEFSDVFKYGEPELPNMLDWIVTKIPSKWFVVGVKLGFTEGVLDGIKMDLSMGGNPNKMFQKVLTNWADQLPSQYNWGVLLQILASPSVGEIRLANSIASQLKGESYFGPEENVSQVCQTSEDVEAVHSILVKVVENNYHRLSNAIDSSLPSFARLLLEADIISRDVCKKAEYNSIMQSFMAGLAIKTNRRELEGDCKSFIKALRTIGGPGKHAAQRIAQQWKESLQTQMSIQFNVD